VHALLVRGLIRRLPTAAGEPVGFTVLNLVRAVLDAEPTADSAELVAVPAE
jgi:hypothetical protein